MTARAALVTGGSRGIGRAIALGLARDGIDVAVNYHRDAAAADRTVEEIRALGRRSRAYQASVGELAQCRQLADQVLADFERLDILVNNAGNASRGHSVVDTDPEELDKVMRTHTFGAHHLCQALLPAFRERQRADVVFISSTAAQHLPARGAPYNMAKAAMEALALTLAKEEMAYGVRVNVVAPGLVAATDMGRRLVRASTGLEDIADLAPEMPFGRLCGPDDVANAVRWLVSDAASYVTAERVVIDGGAGPR